MNPWQAVGDCTWCKVEGATIELIDPEHGSFAYGRAATLSCNLCGYAETYDGLDLQRCVSCGEALTEGAREAHACEACGHAPAATVTDGIDLQDGDAVRTALLGWARREGLEVDELTSGSLGLDPDTLVTRLAAGEPIESSLHAIAFLFPGVAAGGSASATVPDDVVPPPAPVIELAPVDVMAPARLLVSVMLADGAIVAGEQAFVEAFLVKHALPPLQPEDLRPWRPHEIGRIESDALARASLEAAVELMHLDGARDGSELRIIRTFARVWGIPEADVARWNERYERRYAPRFSVLWRALSRWVG